MVLVNNPASRPDLSCPCVVQPELPYLEITPKEKYLQNTRTCPIRQEMKNCIPAGFGGGAGKGLE
jgi:hypothetical protein